MSQPAPQQIFKQLVDTASNWLKVFARLILAVLVTATLVAMCGYTFPYVPTFKGNLQEAGIFAACLTYWLKS